MKFTPLKSDSTNNNKSQKNFDQFPNTAVLTLLKDKGGVQLNECAVAMLGIPESESKTFPLATMLGSVEGSSDIQICVYSPEESKVSYVNKNKKELKRSAMLIAMGTLRGKSGWIYDELHSMHSSQNEKEDRYFLLVGNSEGFCLLEAFHVQEESSIKEIPANMGGSESKELDAIFATQGEAIEIALEN